MIPKGANIRLSRKDSLISGFVRSNLPIPVLGLFFLLLVYNRSYLLFHVFVELGSSAVALALFFIFWNTVPISEQRYGAVLGPAYLFVAVLDVFHTLSYRGMGILDPALETNVATQLWVAARVLEAFALFIAVLLIQRESRVNETLADEPVPSKELPQADTEVWNKGSIVLQNRWFLAITLVFLIVMTTIFIYPVFPECYSSQGGMTLFKKTAEIFVCSLLALAMLSAFFSGRVRGYELRLLVISIAVTILSELCFVLYVSVYDWVNMTGHLFKAISFYCIYKAMIFTNLRCPYSTLFRNLAESEQALRAETRRLQEAMDQIKILRGLLPICSKCKKIRDTQGYWQQVEEYIASNSEADFTHSLCPHCLVDLYGEEIGGRVIQALNEKENLRKEQ